MLSLVIVMVLLWQVFHMHMSINCRMTLLPALHLFKWTTTRDNDDNNWKWSWNLSLYSSTDGHDRKKPRDADRGIYCSKHTRNRFKSDSLFYFNYFFLPFFFLLQPLLWPTSVIIDTTERTAVISLIDHLRSSDHSRSDECIPYKSLGSYGSYPSISSNPRREINSLSYTYSMLVEGGWQVDINEGYSMSRVRRTQSGRHNISK